MRNWRAILAAGLVLGLIALPVAGRAYDDENEEKGFHLHHMERERSAHAHEGRRRSMQSSDETDSPAGLNDEINEASGEQQRKEQNLFKGNSVDRIQKDSDENQ